MVGIELNQTGNESSITITMTRLCIVNMQINSNRDSLKLTVASSIPHLMFRVRIVQSARLCDAARLQIGSVYLLGTDPSNPKSKQNLLTAPIHRGKRLFHPCLCSILRKSFM